MSLELIPRLLVILIPSILLLIKNIITPTMRKAIKAVREKIMLKTTNYTIKGYAVNVIVITLEG